MTKRAAFYAILMVVIAIAIGVGVARSVGGQHTELARSDVQAPKPQEKDDRTWRSYEKRLVLTLEKGADYLLHYPAALRVAGGDLFVRDDGDLSIKRFSPQGDLRRVYGGREGQGPGELTSLTDFFVDRAGRIWLVDVTNGRISIFEEDGRLTTILPLRRPPYRLITASNSRFVVMQEPVHASHLFAEYAIDDGDAALASRFGVLIEHQERDSLALDGWVYGEHDGSFVFAPIFAGYLASFDATGTMRFLVETIDPIGLPRMKRHEDGLRTVRPDSTRSALSVSVDEGKIYLLTMLRSGLETFGAIDVYSNDDGSYLYSLRMPETAMRVVVQDGHVYTLKETRVRKWEIILGGASEDARPGVAVSTG